MIALPCLLPLLGLAQGLSLDELRPHPVPPPERGPVLEVQVEGWRREALALEHGDGVERDPPRAAELYCRAARYGDAEAQFNLAWMLSNGRGILRDDAQAAHLFAAAAEQGMLQAQNMLRAMGTPRGAPPPCLRPPEADDAAPEAAQGMAARPPVELPWPPPPPQAPAPIVRFVDLVAPDFELAPALVLAVIATESNFDASAVSPKNAIGLMQLIAPTARRFGVRDPMDPAQNIRGGMAYLRWLLAYFEGDVVLATAGYNAGEGAVDRYKGVPPYRETREYVKRIQTLFRKTEHRYDQNVTTPSPVLRTLVSRRG